MKKIILLLLVFSAFSYTTDYDIKDNKVYNYVSYKVENHNLKYINKIYKTRLKKMNQYKKELEHYKKIAEIHKIANDINLNGQLEVQHFKVNVMIIKDNCYLKIYRNRVAQTIKKKVNECHKNLKRVKRSYDRYLQKEKALQKYEFQVI